MWLIVLKRARGDPGDRASAPPGGEGGGAEGGRRAAAQTGKSGPALALNLGLPPSLCPRFEPTQVGVFSPSHRNHYLNVTPNNLLRIYSPDGVARTSTQLPPLVLVRVATFGDPGRTGINRNVCVWSPGARVAHRPPGARVPDAAALRRGRGGGGRAGGRRRPRWRPAGA